MGPWEVGGVVESREFREFFFLGGACLQGLFLNSLVFLVASTQSNKPANYSTSFHLVVSLDLSHNSSPFTFIYSVYSPPMPIYAQLRERGSQHPRSREEAMHIEQRRPQPVSEEAQAMV